jgi:hypothetical protein
MINPAPYLRQKLFALLNNAISYDGQSVPVYESEGKDTDKVQIIIGEFTTADASNHTTFNSRARQVIEVISQQPKTTKKIVDIIGQSVTTTLQPDRHTDTMSGDDFQVMIQGAPSINYLDEVSGSGSKIIRLILGYDLLVIQRES